MNHFVRITIVFAFIVIASAEKSSGRTYATNFPYTQNPISEGGVWINGQSTGLSWANVSTTPGFARGQQQPDSGNYNDSTALLTGQWNPDQSVQVVVINNSPYDSSVREVEIRLRSTLTAQFCSGYEVYWSAQASNPYLSIARWNGPLNSYANLAEATSGVTMHNGDQFSASISGSTIRAYINGVQKLQVVDSNFSAGNPGMGFYLANTGGNPAPQSQYGFSSFSATDGATPTSSPSATPTPTVSATPPPNGTPAILQHSSKVISGSAGTITGVYPSGEIGGDLNIIQVVHPSAQRVISVTDTHGNAYRLAKSTPVSSYQLEVWYASSVAAGSDAVTVTFSSNTSNPGLCFAEASGVSILDATAGTASNNGVAMNSGSVTVTSARELLWGSFLTGNSFQASGSGWTHLDTDGFGDGDEYQVIHAVGSYSATATQGSGSFSASILAAFK